MPCMSTKFKPSTWALCSTVSTHKLIMSEDPGHRSKIRQCCKTRLKGCSHSNQLNRSRTTKAAAKARKRTTPQSDPTMQKESTRIYACMHVQRSLGDRHKTKDRNLRFIKESTCNSLFVRSNEIQEKPRSERKTQNPQENNAGAEIFVDKLRPVGE